MRFILVGMKMMKMKKYRLVTIDIDGKLRHGTWQDARNISVFTLNLNTGINNNLYKKWWYEYK
jgi:hypothetical protein